METRWSLESHKILEHATSLVNYNNFLLSNFSDYFGKVILEIGSGQGALSKLLPKRAIVVLSDVFPEYLAELKKKYSNPVMFLDIEKQSSVKYKEKFDTIFSSNVFEHIKDDGQAFRNCHRLLEPGGQLLLFVPARPEIFGVLDVQMGHFRRYTKDSLRMKAESAGFNVKEIYYTNFPGYFIWWGRGYFLERVFKSKQRLSNLDNRFAKFFDLLIVPLLYLEKIIRPPVGQSLVLVAKKEKLSN